MNGRRRSWLVIAAALLAVSAAGLYETLRKRPPAAPPVESAPPADPGEVERIEGGLTWVASREGRPLFELSAGTLRAREGGVRFFDEVRRLRAYLEDGRAVDLRARRGRVEDRGRRGFLITLSGDVEVRDPDRLTLRTARLVYDADTRVLSSPEPATIRGQRILARVGGFVYRPDGRVVETDRGLIVDSWSGRPLHIEASRARYRIATGEVVFDGPFRVGDRDRWLLGGPSTLPLDAEESGETVRIGGPVLLSDASGGATAQLAAPELTVTPDREAPRRAAAGDPVSVLYRPSSAGAAGSASFGRLEAEEGAEPGTWRLSGRSWFELRGQEPGAEWRVAGDRFTAERGPAGRWRRIAARGTVSVSGPDRLAARGDELLWEAERPDTVTLTGSPARASQGEDVVEAPRFLLDRASGQVTAEGGALTEVRSIARRPDTLLGASGGEPARVRSRRVTFPRGSGPVLFEEEVQAWFGTTSLRAARLSVDRAAERLHAAGDVVLRLERTVEGGPARTVRVSGATLDYESRRRRAVVEGAARYEEEEAIVQADRIAVDLDEEGAIAHLEASGSATLAMGRARGRADRLVWKGGASGIVILVGERGPAELETPEQGVLRTRRVRYDLSRRTAVAESGAGRGVIEASPATGREDEERR
ncbi:MAG: hypothetical protein D6718_09330 [Acidobacteria bacterium]|nr:MAG: hypothetical protein D6718_09330 [Acidobacteriota bacterium]